MKHLLFDLDGTLTDSGEGIIRCGQEVLAHFGMAVPAYEDLRHMVGPPLKDSLIRLGIGDEDMAEAIEVYRQTYVDHGQYQNVPYPGIDDLLKKLQADGYGLYVATSKPETMATYILDYFGLARYFRRICGSTLDGSRITKAQVLEHLLGQLPRDEKILMIGDTIYDVEGANELGIPCVGVAWGYGDEAQMLAAGALQIVHTMEQLQTFIRDF